MTDWQIILGIVLSVAGFFFAIYKWKVARADKIKEDINSAQDRSLADHAARLDRHSERLNRLDQIVAQQREEMTANYAKIDRIQELEGNIAAELAKVHERLSGMARDLNQTMGEMKATQNKELQHILVAIEEALRIRG